MKIKRITSQSRRDFWAEMECEHCGNVEKNVSGYDDDNFHQNVIPKMVCKACGGVSPVEYRALRTKYGAADIV